MRNFFITTGIISLTGSLLLLFKFNYSLETISYHLLIVFSIHLFVFAANLLLLRTTLRLRNWCTDIVNFIFFFCVVMFYLLTTVSIAFWGMAITARLAVNYFSSFDELINILPLESWIVYTILVILVVVIVVSFWFIRPKPNQVYINYGRYISNQVIKTRILPVLALLLIIGISFNKQFIQLKRYIHFSGEPLMEFALGQMWDTNTMDYIYNEERIKNTLRDKQCIESISTEKNKNPNRVVIVILFDALRKDFLPIYGYNRQTTPFLDSLKKAGNLLFVKYPFSTSTTTLLGVAGLFGSKDWETFSYTGLNIMKFLKRKEFTTYAFLTGQHRSWYGLANIYKNDCDHFYESTINPSHQNYDDFTTVKKFGESTISPNSFVYFHFLSTHNIGKKHSEFKKFTPDKIGLGTDKKTALVNNYDNGILQADYVISQIFSKLKKDNLLDIASIYIVSDHGELFGEDGQWSHSGNVQKDVISIPMLIYDQNVSWYKNLEVATIKDIAPTIADRLGYPIPLCWEGKSLGKYPQRFSTKINSGSPEDYPNGILSWQDSTVKLQIMDKLGNINKTIIKEHKKEKWETVPNN